MKRQTLWLACGFLVFGRVATTQTLSPAEATVFVRVVGAVEVEPPGFFSYQIGDSDTEIAVGSGFVISPSGYVLTNHHVVAGEDITLYLDGEPLEASIDVQRIEVAFPKEMNSDEPARFYRASVEAVDPDLDLALLLIHGANLPYVPLGDSAAIQFGDQVRILGYPLGWDAEVARKSIDRVVPEVSISRGALSAVRRDERGAPVAHRSSQRRGTPPRGCPLTTSPPGSRFPPTWRRYTTQQQPDAPPTVPER